MDPITRTKKSQKVTIVGAIVDLLLSVFKVIVGVIGNSGALVADGVHSFSDLLTGLGYLVCCQAGWRSSR